MNQVVTSLHIAVSKLKQVVIETILEDGKAFVFDGPGFLSKKRRIVQVPFLCSAFQCILQLREDYLYELNNCRSNIKFGERWHSSKGENISLKNDDKKILTLTEQRSFYRVFRVAVPDGKHVNVSILSLRVEGDQHPQCLFFMVWCFLT